MRIDALLYKEGVFPSRSKASQAVLDGLVSYKGQVVLKPSTNVEDFSLVKVEDRSSFFVSNGGYKLEKAIKDFNLDVNGLVFADIGASNGGFTDCLLKNGAKKVFAVDVGETQLDKTLIQNDKVIVKDNTNARFITEETLGEKVDGVTVDVSFISLTYILQGVKNVLKNGGFAVFLIKPQFECGKEYLGNSGIVKSENARKLAVKKIYDACLLQGLYAVDFTTAPIKEKKNVEYLILVKNNDNSKTLRFEDFRWTL